MNTQHKIPCTLELYDVLIGEKSRVNLRLNDIIRLQSTGEYMTISHLHWNNGEITVNDVNGHGVIEQIKPSGTYTRGDGSETFVYAEISAHWRATKLSFELEVCDECRECE